MFSVFFENHYKDSNSTSRIQWKVPLNPKTMKKDGFTTPKYGLYPLKMKVEGSHGNKLLNRFSWFLMILPGRSPSFPYDGKIEVSSFQVFPWPFFSTQIKKTVEKWYKKYPAVKTKQIAIENPYFFLVEPHQDGGFSNKSYK